MVTFRDLGFVGNDRHASRARIFSCPDDFNNVGVFSGDERIAVEEQIHLDDLDRLLARDVFADENVDLALNKIVHHQLFAGELLIKVKNVGHVAVWKLQSNHLRSTRLRVRGRGRSRRLGSARGWKYSRDRWVRTRRLAGRGLEWRRLGRLRCDWRNLSKARTGRDKQQNRSMHGFNGGDDATRCARRGQFASVTPRKGKTQRRTGHGARSHSKNAMLENIPFPRLMKNFLRILALVVFAVPGIAFSGDFKSQVIAGGQSVDLPHVGGDQFMLIRNFTQEGGTADRGFITVNHNVNVL